MQFAGSFKFNSMDEKNNLTASCILYVAQKQLNINQGQNAKWIPSDIREDKGRISRRSNTGSFCYIILFQGNNLQPERLRLKILELNGWTDK